MRKTKIICTLGPSTDKEGVLRELVANGMNVARFNFSHGSYEEHKGRLDNLKAIRAELGKPVAALLDTKGPEIRLKDFKNGVENLVAGQTFTLTTRDVEGTNEICSITYKDLPMDVEPNGTIMLDDGLIKLRITNVTDTDITCEVLNSGKIKNKKGVNVPGVHLSMPYMSQRDRDDIIFGVQQGFDFIAASFVRTAQDVYDIRNLLNEYDSNIRIIAKIENQPGIDNIEEIFTECAGIMIARGDMGVEVPYEELPSIQKELIGKCRLLGKRVITATEMLESMTHNIRPTRAEIADVANAVYDGTSAIMLSGETAAGEHPVEALSAMARIAEYTEAHINYAKRFPKTQFEIHDTLDAISHATCGMAIDIGAKVITVCSITGRTARLISRFRGPTDIIGLTTNERAYRKLALSWGITPVMSEVYESTDVLFYHALKVSRAVMQLEKGDKVIITGGIINGRSGNTNTIKVEYA